MNLPAIRPGSLASGAVVLTLVAAVTVGVIAGLELAILVLSSGALTAVIVLFWLSVRNLSGDTPLTIDEALGMGAPTAAEEQKRAVLRALKDLEFERSVGKISEQDYIEFSARYRAEAKRLIAAVDESLGPVQELAEKLATQRLERAGLLGAAATKAEPERNAEPEAPAAEGAEDREAPPESARPVKGDRTCASCNTVNDLDAAFCKRCGAPFEAAPRNEPAPARPVEEEAP